LRFLQSGKEVQVRAEKQGCPGHAQKGRLRVMAARSSELRVWEMSRKKRIEKGGGDEHETFRQGKAGDRVKT